MTFGEKLQKLRKIYNLSQEQLAEKIQISRQAVSKWELDASLPDADKLLKISKLFLVSIDYLLDNEIESFENIISFDIKSNNQRCGQESNKMKDLWINKSNKLFRTSFILMLLYSIIVEMVYLTVPLIHQIIPYHTIISTAVVQLFLIFLIYLMKKTKERKSRIIGFCIITFTAIFQVFVKPLFTMKDVTVLNMIIESNVRNEHYSIGQIVASLNRTFARADYVIIIEIISILILTIATTIKYVCYKNEYFGEKNN